ncbi:MAG: hypothetical protein WCL56_06540 [Sediminibacterium sp.]
MYKAVLFLYLICFGTYTLFTRQPDYFDGEKAPATIVLSPVNTAEKQIPKAIFSNGYHQFSVDAAYYFRSLHAGDKVEVIYEMEHPEKAVLYKFWGYWFGFGELIGSFVFLLVSFQVAVAITKNPDPTSLEEQLAYKEPVKRRYDD